MENIRFTVTDDLLASNGQRFINVIIDLLIQHIIGLSIAYTITLIAQATNWFALADWIEDSDFTEQLIIGIVLSFCYYSVTEIYFSRSIAKYFTKTLVVMRDGSKPSNKTIIIRTLCRFIPFEAFTYLGENARGWHDYFSETYVVRKRRFHVKKKLYDSF